MDPSNVLKTYYFGFGKLGLAWLGYWDGVLFLVLNNIRNGAHICRTALVCYMLFITCQLLIEVSGQKKDAKSLSNYLFLKCSQIYIKWS